MALSRRYNRRFLSLPLTYLPSQAKAQAQAQVRAHVTPPFAVLLPIGMALAVITAGEEANPAGVKLVCFYRWVLYFLRHRCG